MSNKLRINKQYGQIYPIIRDDENTFLSHVKSHSVTILIK
jgi:hypothetical protein